MDWDEMSEEEKAQFYASEERWQREHRQHFYALLFSLFAFLLSLAAVTYNILLHLGIVK